MTVLTSIFRGVAAGAFVAGVVGHTPEAKAQDDAMRQASMPRFSRIAPEVSGIAFESRIDAESPRRQLYVHGFGGGGVCVGDYDADGLPDIFLTGQARGSALFRQVSPWKFEDVTRQLGLEADEWDSGATFVDIDNDGDLDLYVCSYDAPNRLYVNQGDGSFVEQAARWGLDFAGASIMAAFSDFDRDGDLDVYLLTNRIYAPLGEGRPPRAERRNGVIDLEPGFEETHAIQMRPIDGREEPFIVQAGQRDLLLRNDGDRFRDVSAEAGIDGLHPGLSVTWWDCDSDGWPDVYVGNDYWDPDFLYRNNRDGTFTNIIKEAVPCTSWFSMGADTADINGDGLMDFLSADMSATTHFMQKTNMGNMGDTNWFLKSAEPRQYMRNVLYVNSGTERFMEAAFLAGLDSTDWTWSVKFGDLDNDGRTDVFFTNGSLNHTFNADFGEKQKELQQRLMSRRGITRLDIDKAQWRLQFDQPPRKEANLAFRNTGDLSFEPANDQWGLGDVGLSYGAALADLDRDGDLDVIVSNLEEPAGLYRNDTDDGKGVSIRLKGSKSNAFGIDAVVEAQTASGAQTKRLTLSRGFMSTNEPILHFGIADDEKIDTLTVRWPSGRVQVETDLVAGVLHTIVEPEEVAEVEPPVESDPLFSEVGLEIGLTGVHRETPFDDYVEQPLLPAKHSQMGPGLALGDVDGDGDDDLFVGGAAGQPGTLYLNDNGMFTIVADGPWVGDALCEDMSALFFDADSDGDLDLYVASGGVEAGVGSPLLIDRLYINTGDSGFAQASQGALPDNPISTGCVVGADYDADGDLDLFVGGRLTPGQYPLAPGNVLLRNEGGRFVDVTDSEAPGLAEAGMVSGALWSDANNDGQPDLLLAIDWGPIRIFKNTNGTLSETTQDAGLSSHLGWWNGITGADIDHDGDIDYIATNVGLNTKYHASIEKPTLLYYGQFDEQSGSRLVEAEWEDESLFPMRGKSCSQNAMPFVRDAFPTYESYALAELPEIYAPSKLDRATRLEATQLESVILINDGEGRFEVRPLPKSAQVSPGFGVVATPIGQYTDIVIAQNWLSPQPETGRWDGGLGAMLLGQEDGTVEPVRADRSGFVSPNDAKALALLDLNGDANPDFLVTQNNDRTLAFRNNVGMRFSSGGWLAVRLEGPAGNPTGVGARVMHSESPDEVFEIYAGSGYLSQTSPLVFLGRVVGDSEVHVRWPDGATSRETAPAGTNTLTISHPSIASDHRDGR